MALVAASVTGLAWAITTLPKTEATDRLVTMRDQLLSGGAYHPLQAAKAFEKLADGKASGCEGPAQIALAQLKIQMAEDALRTGAAAEFNKHIDDLKLLIRQTLSCAPYQAYFWLLAFWTHNLNSGLNKTSLELLAMSYDTAPSEAWIAVRRNNIAVNIIPLATSKLRDQILFEFSFLVRDQLMAEAATSYAFAKPPVQKLLQQEILKLPQNRQQQFWSAIKERMPADQENRPML